MMMMMILMKMIKVSIFNLAELNNNQLWPPVAAHVTGADQTWVESDDVATSVRLNLSLPLLSSVALSYLFATATRAPYTNQS